MRSEKRICVISAILYGLGCTSAKSAIGDRAEKVTQKRAVELALDEAVRRGFGRNDFRIRVEESPLTSLPVGQSPLYGDPEVIKAVQGHEFWIVHLRRQPKPPPAQPDAVFMFGGGDLTVFVDVRDGRILFSAQSK